MDEFFPYHDSKPEDEYAPIDSASFARPQQAARQAAQPAPRPQAPHQVPPAQQPAQQPVQQMPVQQPMQQPVQQMPIQQPVQQPYPAYGYQQPQPRVAQPVYPAQPTAGMYYVPVYYPTTQVPYLTQQSIPQQTIPQQHIPQQAMPQQTMPQIPTQNTAVSARPYAPAAPMYIPPAQEKKPKEPNPPTSTGTKVFLIVLCALLVAMVGGFIAYIASLPASENASNAKEQNSPNFIEKDLPETGENEIENNSGKELDVEISLVADDGATQKRSTDNPDSVGAPDKNAKEIELAPLPKDKDDAKYTTQSAYETVCDSVVTVECFDGEVTDNVYDLKSQGTGTIITSDGYLITNAHVIGNSKEWTINVVLNTGDEYIAKVVGYDTWTDLAVLKIDAKDLKAVTFGDSELINIGDDVITIGSPGGAKFQNSLTKGIVSAVDREISISKRVKYIQSDAAISPGNSGGPLCNIYGQVIGITTAKTVATYYENMTFSIPSTTVQEIASDLMRYGYVRGRVRIGFSGSEISREDSYYYDVPQGIIIGEIDENGALAGTDVKEDDIITAIDGVEITTFQDIYDVLADHKEGDKVTLTIYRYEE